MASEIGLLGCGMNVGIDGTLEVRCLVVVESVVVEFIVQVGENWKIGT